MFRSSTIIRKLALNLAKVIFMLKHSAKFRRYFTQCFNINITLARFSASSLMMTKTETCRSDVYVYFNVNFNVFFKLIKVHLLVSELYIYQTARCNDKNCCNHAVHWVQSIQNMRTEVLRHILKVKYWTEAFIL